MRTTGVWIVLLVLLSACAGQPTEQPASFEQMMDNARQMAAEGKEINFVLTLREPGEVEGGVYVFYNNPEPFCYTYMIPGNWVEDPKTPRMYRATDGEASAGVLFFLAKQLDKYQGQSLVERAKTMITQEHEKMLGQELDVEFVPFESARPGTWEWKAAPVERDDFVATASPKVIVDLSPDAIVQITVGGPSDSGALARRIIDSLKTTSDPECYWTALEMMLRSVYEENGQGY